MHFFRNFTDSLSRYYFKHFTMRILSCLIVSFFVCQTAFCVDFNANEISLINQKLENILSESKKLPQNSKSRIQSEVNDIRSLLTDKVRIIHEHSEHLKNSHQENLNEPEPIKIFDVKEISDLCARIKSAGEYKNQLVLFKRIPKNTSFTIQQILDLTNVIALPVNQKEVVLLLLPKAIDQENVDLLYKLFSTESEQEKIDKISEEYLK